MSEWLAALCLLLTPPPEDFYERAPDVDPVVVLHVIALAHALDLFTDDPLYRPAFEWQFLREPVTEERWNHYPEFLRRQAADYCVSARRALWCGKLGWQDARLREGR